MNNIFKFYFSLIAVIVLSITLKAYSQDKDLPKELFTANGIPDSLKEDANSIVRYSSDELTVEGSGKAIIKHHSLITILNEKGDKAALIEFPYNKKFDTYSDIEIRAYNAEGVQIKKYRKSDMYDGAAINNEILVSDERFLGLQHVVASYPTTIEIQYEEELGGFINLAQWDIQTDEQAIQNESYKVIVKPDMGFRYKCKNISLDPLKVSNDGVDSYVWHVGNKKAFKLEDGAVTWRVLPKLEFGVNKFTFYGNAGEFDSWKDFGKWLQQLNADVCNLSPARVVEIQKMTENIKTDKEKAKFLYEYMQHDMRYVAIALGIGGLKPFPAMFVDQKKYGDCKAFSNYMCALLKAVNIKAYYAVVEAGSNGEPSDPQFPYDISDHIICCIPFKNDTTWLECTSRTQPFGKLGPFTENRNALLITEDGGELVNTPKSIAQDNQFNSEVHLAIDSDGSATAKVKILCSGVYRDDYVDYLPNLKADEQKQEIMQRLNIKQASVFDYIPGADNDGVKEVDLNLEYDKFCDIIAGDKQFYHPHVFDLCAFTVPLEEKRKSDYYFDAPMQKTCVTTIDLPKGYEVETLPANQSLKFSYGSYDVKYTYDAAKNQVTGTANFIINNQLIPAAKYNELQQYLDAVAKAQNKKLVIRKKA